jgi:hypothetical protein
MPKRSPWHSTQSEVYHDNTECNTGNNRERVPQTRDRRQATLCQECARLDSQGH